MKLKRWIEKLFKQPFYLWPQPIFVSGSCGQKALFHLKSFEPYMPLPSARRVAICFCWVLFLAIPAAVFGQTNYYAAEGTQYPIVGSLPGDQVYPDVALNANGGYIVWQDNITDPVGEGISAMRLNSTLSGSGDIFQVNSPTTNNQQNAHVAISPKNVTAFVWEGGPTVHQRIFGRVLNSSGVWFNTTNFLVSTYTNTFQTDPAIAALTNGNFIVVWSSYNQAGSNTMLDVYGQMLSTNGARIGTNFLVNQFTTYNQRNPAVAVLNNGQIVVAWVSEQQRTVASTNSADSSPSSLALPTVDIYERIFAVSGTNVIPVTGEILVNQDNNPCARPAIAAASDGSYMVTWCAEDMANSSNGWDIYERSFVFTNGSPVNLVNSYTYGDQYAPRISAIGGDYLIVWTSLAQDGSREGVYGQYVHEGGSLVGGEFLVNTTTLGQQMHQAVASDGKQQFLTVWTSFTFGPNGFDLYAQRYANTASTLEPLGAPFVWAPFVLTNGVYQPELVVSWPVIQGLSISNYEVFVDGRTPPMAVVTGNQWVMTAADGLTPTNTHSFALEYQTTSGLVSPMSPSASGTTWEGCDYYGVPCEWMEEFYGNNIGSWPSATTPVAAGGPTLLQIFLSGGNPTNPATWLKTTLTQTSQGMFLSWNTQPGMTYQVQVTTDFRTWTNFGAPRFEAGTSDSVFVGNGAAGYYRVQLLWQ